ncbi:hypothetical protein KCM76_24390 [Zooshikella marina]|uniref:hypothetical protein n=1 Tax=Zooshikella ganghwensis TaxID=202772 RepID=UPI001BAFB305|nr:hypothetical protein [Zooshikella ganghwensis]MBU2709157.1 hypothetical protein [Zooshikella ganghwensis]
MEHLTIYFKHGIQDIVPYTDFIMKIKAELHSNGLGQYLGDDMAIDGVDAEVVFSCVSANELFEYIKVDLANLPFMQGAKITFTFGELESSTPVKEFYL